MRKPLEWSGGGELWFWIGVELWISVEGRSSKQGRMEGVQNICINCLKWRGSRREKEEEDAPRSLFFIIDFPFLFLENWIFWFFFRFHWN